jgi:hypothetical protein
MLTRSKLALVGVVALFLMAPPAVAQVTTSTSQLNGQELSGQNGQSSQSQAPTTGIICQEEVTGTFCNAVVGPTSGYGTTSGVGSNTPVASIPPCDLFPPANELCN